MFLLSGITAAVDVMYASCAARLSVRQAASGIPPLARFVVGLPRLPGFGVWSLTRAEALVSIFCGQRGQLLGRLVRGALGTRYYMISSASAAAAAEGADVAAHGGGKGRPVWRRGPGPQDALLWRSPGA